MRDRGEWKYIEDTEALPRPRKPSSTKPLQSELEPYHTLNPINGHLILSPDMVAQIAFPSIRP